MDCHIEDFTHFEDCEIAEAADENNVRGSGEQRRRKEWINRMSETMKWEGVCYDCGSTEFLGGPRGPGGQNIECGHCGSRFNVSQFGADRIGHRDEGKEEKDALVAMGNLIVDHDTGEAIEPRGKQDRIGRDTLGVHIMCNGWVEIKQVSPDWNILHCRSCGLRKYFPAVIDLQVYDKVTIWKHLHVYFESLKNDS